MKIKVCGLRDPDNISLVANLQPDYIGFICYDKSPRFINGLKTDVLLQFNTPLKTGIFVNEKLEKIIQLIDEYKFDVVQLHGNETPEFCESLKRGVQVWKAFGIDNSFNFETLKPYAGNVDYFLFDTKTSTHGGSGQTFDWAILDNYVLDIPFFLSGGLSPENIGQVLQIKHPMFYGVDLNSRFETEPGIKDIDKLRQAFDILRQSATNEI